MDTDKATSDTASDPAGDTTSEATRTSAGEPADTTKRTFVEEVEVTGGQLVTRVKELFEDASAKRVVIRSSDGDELMTIPLTVGVAVGGILTLAAPLLAALGALAALVTRVRLQVIREGDPVPHHPSRPEDPKPPT